MKTNNNECPTLTCPSLKPGNERQNNISNYELMTDELSVMTAKIYSLMKTKDELVLKNVERVLHANAVPRTGKGFDAVWIVELEKAIKVMKKEYGDEVSFVLPLGVTAALASHSARVKSKLIAKFLIDNFPEHVELKQFFSTLGNYFFALALTINKDEKFKEVKFTSKAYG